MKRSRLKVGGGSYLASHDLRDTPTGRRPVNFRPVNFSSRADAEDFETFTDLPINRYITIVEGSGIR